MTLTLTLDRAILHTVMHHSSTSTYIANVIGLKSNKLFVDGQTNVRVDGHLRPTLLGRLEGVDLKIMNSFYISVQKRFLFLIKADTIQYGIFTCAQKLTFSLKKETCGIANV